MEYLRFFEGIINAGTILSGFVGTFLAFRIQRESNYYRQPVLDFKEEKAKDVYIGLTHFTSSFLLIILSAIGSIIFGFVIPLFALSGSTGILINPPFVVSGLVGSLVLLIGYFADELIHYGILSQRLVDDAAEWGRERILVLIVLILAIILSFLAYNLSG